MHPTKAFPPPASRIAFSRSNCSNSIGIGPVSAFSFSHNSFSRVNCPSSGGIPPLNLFKFSHNASSRRSSPNSGGIGPVSSLLASISTFNPSSPPNSGGITPVNPAQRKSTLVTRGGVPSTLTPRQRKIGFPYPQVNRKSPDNVSFTSIRMLQSLTSPEFSRGLATTIPLSQVGPITSPGPRPCHGCSEIRENTSRHNPSRPLNAPLAVYRRANPSTPSSVLSRYGVPSTRITHTDAPKVNAASTATVAVRRSRKNHAQ